MSMKQIEDTIVGAGAGIAPGDPVHGALEARADIMAMTEEAHDASLTPAEPGGLSHAERAALAVRIARLSGADGLVGHYETLMDKAGCDKATAALADPASGGAGDGRRSALLAYVDQAAVSPREATADDIVQMQAAGIEDADIVRLAELVAYLSYQIRLVAGLKLIKATS